ncbi:hypothetical protein MHAE_07669 [Mycobacterium haemophilum DSM 44634]|uniref:EAL domain-containing protein n=1 Tax=Mycobacterium haemophilum TaxID=29311 RepID=UPI0006D5BE12
MSASEVAGRDDSDGVSADALRYADVECLSTLRTDGAMRSGSLPDRFSDRPAGKDGSGDAKDRSSGWSYGDPDCEQGSARDGLLQVMPAALDRGEFFLVYQPIVRLNDKRFIGVEALLRWAHPTLGTLLPARFIGLAERNGMIVPLTAFVIEQACRHIRNWRDDSTNPRPFVSVNVSARNVQDPGFLPMVERVLGDTGLPAHALQLELTENASLSIDEASITRLQELSAIGVGIAIDDFGTGFSSLAYLRNLPVDMVKLAGEFIENLGGDIHGRLADEQITRAMIDLAFKLGITVCAKRVETPGQAARLRDFGCDAAQGWHFAKALPADFFTE